MSFSRRTTLKMGAVTLGALGGANLMPFVARAQEEDHSYEVEGGSITIHPVSHASFVMETPDMVIYNDPVGGAELYADYPEADLILITHEHDDHYDPETLSALMGEETQLITNEAVHGMLPDELKEKATALANGDSTEVGGMSIEAVPAYNITAERLQYHPQGRDNGYVLTIGGKRVYIAGDTEATEEFRSMEDIFIAFVPMNLPYTMDVEQAAGGVAAFEPEYVYPYHYRDSDPEAFAQALDDSQAATEVVMGPWYE